MRKVDVSNVRIPGTQLQGWRAVAVGALALYIVVFIVINDKRLEVNFLLFRVRSNALLALIVIAVLSFAAGFFLARGRRPPPPD